MASFSKAETLTWYTGHRASGSYAFQTSLLCRYVGIYWKKQTSMKSLALVFIRGGIFDTHVYNYKVSGELLTTQPNIRHQNHRVNCILKLRIKETPQAVKCSGHQRLFITHKGKHGDKKSIKLWCLMPLCLKAISLLVLKRLRPDIVSNNDH